MTEFIHAKYLKNLTKSTSDMVEIGQLDVKFDLWPHATRKQEFSKIWNIAQIEGLNWF